jgi:O-antigen/teichoic acid export membrane protein
MQRKFLTNLGLILFLNLLVKPFWILGIDRTVQNVVGTDYGFYFAVFNFSFLFNILLDLGITNFNNRNIAQNNHLLNKHFSRIFYMKLLLALVYFTVTFCVAFIIGYRGRQLFFLLVLGFNQFLISMVLYLRSNISGLLLFRTDSFLSVLDRTLMILFCSVLLWGHITRTPFRIEWFIFVQTAAYFLTALTALFIVIRKAAFRRLHWNRLFFIMIIKKSFPFALLVLLMTFYNRIDSVMIERLLHGRLGDEQVTVYASAFRLLDATNMIAFLFSVLLIPIFSRMIKRKESIEQMVRLSFTLLMTIAVIVAIGSYFYSYELMNLLYVRHIRESAQVFKILMLGFVAISTSYVFGSLLTANGSLKQLNIIAAGSMVISISLNFLLIPHLLAVGSAYASIVTQFLSALVQVLVAQLIFKFRINYRFIFGFVTFIAGVIVINVVSRHLGTAWMINFVIMVIGSLILASLLRMLNIRSLVKIIRTEGE